MCKNKFLISMFVLLIIFATSSLTGNCSNIRSSPSACAECSKNSPVNSVPSMEQVYQTVPNLSVPPHYQAPETVPSPHIPPTYQPPHLPSGVAPHLPSGAAPHLPSGAAPHLPSGAAPHLPSGAAPHLPSGSVPLGRSHVVPDSYFENGKFQPLFTGVPFPITINTKTGYGYGTTLVVTLQAVNTIEYELFYNYADGRVMNVDLRSATLLPGTPEQLETENKVKHILARCQQIAFEKGGLIQFRTDNGSTRISFEPVRSRRLQTMETRHVVPSSYFQNGVFQPLYSGTPFPIYIYTDHGYGYGTSLVVTLKAVNTIQYELMYNYADGRVLNVLPRSETPGWGTADGLAAEHKVKNIIANCQQIVKDSYGGMQFITDHGSTRITFSF